MADEIEVEVAYARADQQRLISLHVAPGTTALDAVRLSGMQQAFPEIDMQHLRLGVFGKAVAWDAVLRARDRVEIYRPLLADPKEVRRRRAQRLKATPSR